METGNEGRQGAKGCSRVQSRVSWLGAEAGESVIRQLLFLLPFSGSSTFLLQSYTQL